MLNNNFSKILVDFIRNIPLFESLNQNELQIVVEYLKIIELKSGEMLFHEWDRADYVCFIEQGRLNIMRKKNADNYMILNTLGRGRSIGELSIIENFPRSTTVEAKEDTRLVVLYREQFELIIKNHSEIGIMILKGLAGLLGQNLRKTSSRLADNMLPLD